MISKEKFVGIMNKLQEAQQLVDDIDKVINSTKYHSFFVDFADANTLFILHDDIVIDLLVDMFNDKNEWISWWIYETNFGKDIEMATVTNEKENKKWLLNTPEALYDFLIEM